jgi:hypothetical protein
MKPIIIFMLLVVSFTNGLTQTVSWDRQEKVIVADSNTMPPQVVGRISLVSNNTIANRIDRVFFTGPEASEFVIIDNQYKLNPLEGFDLGAQDLLWVDVAFVPNYNKLYPLKFADRQSVLIATYFIDAKHSIRDTTSIDVIGTFNQKLSVAQPVSATNLKVFVADKQIIVELPESESRPYECSLYDILGRTIKTWPMSEMLSANSKLLLPLPTISAGTYILSIKAANDTRTSMILIQ